MGSRLDLHGDASLNENVDIEKQLNVYGSEYIDNNLIVNNNAKINQYLTVDNDASFNEKMFVSNDSTFYSTVDISALDVNNNTILRGQVNIDNSGNNTSIGGGNVVVTAPNVSFDCTNGVDVDSTTLSCTGAISDSGYNIYANRVKIDTLAVTTIEPTDVSLASTMNMFTVVDFSGGDASGGQDGFANFSVDTTFAGENTFTSGSTVDALGVINIGYMDNMSEDQANITNTNFNLYATQSSGKGINYRGDVAFGNKDAIGDHDVNIYGDLIMHNNLTIKEGYNLIVESGSSYTQLETEVQVTNILEITNQGTGPTLTVNQTETTGNDIAHFQDDSYNVVVIGENGNTGMQGRLRVGYDLADISSSLADSFFVSDYYLDVSSDCQVLGDISAGAIHATNGVIREKLLLGTDETTTPNVVLDIRTTDAVKLPVGTTAQRPTAGTGMIRYNTTTSQFEGYSSNAWQGLGGVIDVDQDTKIIAQSSPGADDDKLQFFTAGVNRMVIDNNGVVNIGGTSGTDELEVSGNAHITGTLTTDSDKRIKDNFEVLSNSLDFVEFLHGYRFTRTDLEDKEKKHIGVVAQEIEQFYPELISTNETTGIKSVNYNGISAVLIECVRSLRHENQELRSSLEVLTEKINNIEKKI